MSSIVKDASFEVDPAQKDDRLDAFLRRQWPELPWSRLRAMVETGKVQVQGRIELDPGYRLQGGEKIGVTMNAPRPGGQARLSSDAIVFVDSHVVVVRKPSGINSIPFEPGERGTLQELVRAWLNRTAKSRNDRATGDLGVVHRIDKETSGLLVFTRSLLAKRHLANQMRHHTTEREYLAIAHGRVAKETFRSNLVENRGDGLRGSTILPGAGRPAVTHVEPVRPLSGATFVRCRLETGRTHQIRIHLSEAGHPLLGESVYVRGLSGNLIQAPRLMLHAAVLGFEHPATGEPLRFEEPLPEDMAQLLARLSKKAAP